MSLRSLVGFPVSQTHGKRNAAARCCTLHPTPHEITGRAPKRYQKRRATNTRCNCNQNAMRCTAMSRASCPSSVSDRARVQGGNMNGLLAARRICMEKVNILILQCRGATNPHMYPPCTRQPTGFQKQGPNPWFLARIMLPFPTVQRDAARCVNQGPFRTRRTSNRPLLQRSSADSKRCDILLAEPLKTPNGGLPWSNIPITYKKTLCIAVQFYPDLLLEVLRYSCRRQLNLLPIPIVPCPPKD